MVRLAIDFSKSGPVHEWYLTDRAFWLLLQKLGEVVPPIDSTLEEVERWQICRAAQNSTTMQEAADRLGMSRRNVYHKQQKHGIDWDRPNQRK